MKTADEIAAELVNNRDWDIRIGISGGTWTLAIAAALREQYAAGWKAGAEEMRERAAMWFGSARPSIGKKIRSLSIPEPHEPRHG